MTPDATTSRARDPHTPDTFAAERAGLDLSQADDRATLRGRLEHTLRGARLSTIQDYARALGAQQVGRSRYDAVRALAAALIARIDHSPA